MKFVSISNMLRATFMAVVNMGQVTLSWKVYQECRGPRLVNFIRIEGNWIKQIQTKVAKCVRKLLKNKHHHTMTYQLDAENVEQNYVSIGVENEELMAKAYLALSDHGVDNSPGEL